MALHRLTLLFEDGRAVRIDARPDETVHAAALRQRVRLASDCLEGACGTCKAFCTEGVFELGDCIDEALSRTERAQGFTLACQMRPASDGVLEFPYPSSQALARLPPIEHAGNLAAIERVAQAVIRLDIDCPASTPFEYLPGQYAHLLVPGSGSVRSYSMANPSERSDHSARLTFYVKVLAAGAMSEYVSSRARVGDAIGVTGPYGHFYLRPVARPILMVAGGTGLAPMLAMLEQMAHAGGSGSPVHLLYGANVAAEFFGGDQLTRLARSLDLRIERMPVAGVGWSGPTGHVTSLLRDELLHGGAADAYLCGPSPMVEAARAWLQQHWVSRIHAEKFVPS